MRHAIRTAALAATLALAGCATGQNPKDPLEPFNRAMFEFNDTVDRAALKPAAKAYAHLPDFVQTGVGNFFGNLADVWTAANNMLQGKLGDGFSDVMRVAVNSTFGLGGLLDIGSEAGLVKHSEDFGQTLGKWGVKSGPYVVLPLFGPSTLRDTAALPLDWVGDPWQHVDRIPLRNSGTALRVVDLRATALNATNLIEEAALDRYEFVRDAFLQRRQSRIMDGQSPRSSYQDEEAEESMADEKKSADAPQSTASSTADKEPDARNLVDSEHDGSKASAPAAVVTEVKN